MPLHSRYVEAIFARLLVRYGTAWTGKWKGVDLEAVKADWALLLEGVSSNAIRYALENLPAEYPPTVAQFRALCCDRPNPEQKRLQAPKADPARVAAELQRMQRVRATRNRLQWAYDLQEREKAGERLTVAQQTAWRDVLARSVPLGSITGDFNPIPVDALPPGMRKEQRT
jgi:hypothetical protein